MRGLTIAGVQFHSEYANKKSNLERIEKLCEQARNRGVDVILFPELCISGFIIDKKIPEIAETVPGPSTQFLEKIARDFSLVISAGLIEIHNGLYFNNMVLVGPDGFIGGYRKVHLPFVEYPYYTAGSTFPVYNVLGYNGGFLTCCDNLFSEQFRILAIKGAELIFSPFCWLYEGKDSFPIKPKGEPEFQEVNRWIKGHLKKILPARIYENGVYLIAANQYGWIGDSGYFASGGVLIFGPDGDIEAENRSSAFIDEIVTARLERKRLIDWRSRGNFSLKLRRPELYTTIINSR